MRLVFGEIQNIERAVDAGQFAGGDADSHLLMKSASNNKKPLIAAVLDRALVHHEYAGQRILNHIYGGDPRIRRQRQCAGQQQSRFHRIKATLTPFSEARGIGAESVSVIGRDAARELGEMNAKLKVFPRFDN